MKREEIILYEAPALSEYIGVGWMQDILARYLSWKVTRKWNRYTKRLERAERVYRMIEEGKV